MDVGDTGVTVEEALRLIGEIDGIKGDTRAAFFDGTWQWLLIWSVVCLGAAASALTPLAGWYWMIGAPAGLAATVIVTTRAEMRVRLRRKPGPYVAVGLAMACANGFFSYALAPDMIVVVIWVVLGVGFAALTWLDRVPAAPGAFVVLTGAAIVARVAVGDGLALYPFIAVAFAIVLARFAVVTWRSVPQ